MHIFQMQQSRAAYEQEALQAEMLCRVSLTDDDHHSPIYSESMMRIIID